MTQNHTKASNAGYFFSLIYFGVFLLSLLTDWYQSLSITILLCLLLSILDKLGKGLPLRESIAFFYVVTCLLFPVLGYTYYTRDNALSNAFIKYMLVPEETYFGTALPSISIFSALITWPFSNRYGVSDQGAGLKKLIGMVKSGQYNLQKTGIIIIITGILVSLVVRFLPGGLSFFAALFYFSSFAGLLYLFYSPPSVYKYLFMTVFIVFLLANALATGMFTVVAYMGITIFSFFFVGSTMRMWRKLLIVFLGVVFILALQSTKGTYREMTWANSYGGNKAVLFAELFLNNLQKSETLFDENEFFPLHMRMNQGWNISKVMARIPSIQDHDGGQQLLTVVAASIVPRAFWPDKPMAGGKFNMLHYAGGNISGFSTNVGPLGEAYGSFGPEGAILFMAVLGIFIRLVYKQFFLLSARIPLLICWLPVLFYQLTYSAETDTLQILNSLVKGSFFLWLLYKFLPSWFGRQANNTRSNSKVSNKLWYN